ncbi:hypothetical protein B566_EDAN017721 [Ephemera danica]|nr:hypothetical protein B566_EDAN017721 [Ephemera danica]
MGLDHVVSPGTAFILDSVLRVPVHRTYYMDNCSNSRANTCHYALTRKGTGGFIRTEPTGCGFGCYR